MRLDLNYASGPQTITVPDRNLLGVLEPPRCGPFHDPAGELGRAAESAAQFVGASRRVLVLVNDYTRPTPTGQVLAALTPALRNAFVRLLVCLGTHRPASAAELDALFGPDAPAALRPDVVQHDCRNQSRLFFLGRTGFGTDVWLNRELLWADKIVAINSVEPHYFAGYTGGRKGLLPGIAGIETIVQNHNLVTSRGSAPFMLEGNPVHEDMAEAAEMVPRPVYSVQTVQDRHHRLLSVRFGGLSGSFGEACADAYRVYALPVREKADVVLSALQPPYDINFYQSQRAVEFARYLLKSPSVQITVSGCPDGIGDDGFIRAFRGCRQPSDVLNQSAPATRLGWHKAARLARIMQTTALFAVTGVGEEAVRSAFMLPFSSPQAALDSALGRIGPDARVYVIPDAGAVVPVPGN